MSVIKVRNIPAPVIGVSNNPPSVIKISSDASIVIGGEQYEGSYDVTPKPTPQELETAKKVMADNVRVEAIPYYAVSNPAGGITIPIGGN